jgi:hypothetical protein
MTITSRVLNQAWDNREEDMRVEIIVGVVRVHSSGQAPPSWSGWFQTELRI